jgi:hypothetical protein
VKRDSDSHIIPKIILILGTLSVLGIILLFFRPRTEFKLLDRRPESTEELFTQVMLEARKPILKIWEEGDRLLKADELNCPEEILLQTTVGPSYYQCQPHLWQCYWQGGIRKDPKIKIDLFGQTYHVKARAVFDAVPAYSEKSRFMELFKRRSPELNLHYAYVVELEVEEIPGLVQPLLLTDSCRDTYLPERIYPYGKVKDPREEGFLWDNFGRRIFIDRFYVTNQQVNAWRVLLGKGEFVLKDRKLWPLPALLTLKEQKQYCNYFGKKPLEAKFFDAATMTPGDLKNPLPDRVMRPQTPWQRDLSKSFLGMARINADYQLTPLDCQLAQVQGCPVQYFTTDSATWMGFNFGLGFFQEALVNTIEPELNLKSSSRLRPAASPVHELGLRDSWGGNQEPGKPVAFRCYEEVSP